MNSRIQNIRVIVRKDRQVTMRSPDREEGKHQLLYLLLTKRRRCQSSDTKCHLYYPPLLHSHVAFFAKLTDELITGQVFVLFICLCCFGVVCDDSSLCGDFVNSRQLENRSPIQVTCWEWLSASQNENSTYLFWWKLEDRDERRWKENELTL